jgi:hypothetical protein
MTDLNGLPDFATMISSSEATMIAPFGSGSYYVLPQQLQLATNADGSPRFELELVQYLGDLTASGEYAELDFSLTGDFPLNVALSLARTPATPNATVQPIIMDSGFGRLYETASTVQLSADMLTPTPLEWWSGDLARWTMRMSLDAGELVKGALQGQSALLLGARVEAAVSGVAPRLGVFAQFDPTTLLSALLANHADRSISIPEILSFFSAPSTKYPVTLTAVPGGSEAILAQIMTDRVIAAYAALAPSPGVTDPASVVFKPISQIDTATTRWDLSEPTLVMRPWIFMLDPIGSVRALNNPAVLAQVVKEISIPAMSLGAERVYLTASLPPTRVGIAAIGAHLQMPPNPPARFFSISETATITPPNDLAIFSSASVSSAPMSATTGYVDFMLGPQEPLQYTVTSFAVIAAGEFIQEYDSTPRPHTETWVQLDAGDFPLTFTYVSATATLLNLATINGVLTYQVGTHQVQQSFSMVAGDGGGAEVTVAAPSVATDVSIALQAVPLDGSGAVSLPSTGPGRIPLDVISFAGFGPHTVTVQCQLGTGAAPLFIEFVSELQATNAQAIPGKVALTPDQPSASWGYVATSPFHPGYCFRAAAVPGRAVAPWSAPCLPDAVLMLSADGTIAPEPASSPLNATSAGGSPTGAAAQDQVASLTQ